MNNQVKNRILQICAELGEDMDSPSCKALRKYIKECPHCEAFVDSVKKTIWLYKAYQPPDTDRVKKELFKKLKL